MKTIHEQIEAQQIISNINIMMEKTKSPGIEFKILWKKSINELRAIQEDSIKKYNLFLKSN